MAGRKVLLLAVLWIIRTDAQYQNTYGHYYQTPSGYQYSWAVQDAPSYNNYRHEESSDGEVVRGFYQVLLPDGRIQTVKYHVEGDSGFVADVTYEGGFDYQGPKAAAPSAPSAPPQYATYPTYPQAYPHYQPVYSAPTYPKPSYYQPVSYYVPYEAEESTTSAPEVEESAAPAAAAPEPMAAEPPVESTEPVDTEETTVAPPVTTTAPQFDYGSPLYRIDYYSARAKSSGYTTPEPYGDEDNTDRESASYIKPAESLAIPERLGTYDVVHRKATARKPSLVPVVKGSE